MEDTIDLGIEGLTGYREVGSGGFAVTYAAWEVDQDRLVAAKVLRADDDGARRRFDRERRTMGTTTGHPHIVTLFRSGYTPGHRPYMVMEYMGGGSLQDRLDHHGPMPPSEAGNAAASVAMALGFSHSMGIVHKDIKPANILVSATGTVKLTDFGIAAIKASTATSHVSYSMAYAAPEAFAASRDPRTGVVLDRRDERSDLYSLAATLFALVTGVAPVDGPQLTMMRQIMEDPVPPTGHLGLDRFLAVAMAKDPGHRYQDASSFLQALGAIRWHEQMTAVVPPPAWGVARPGPSWPQPPPPAPHPRQPSTDRPTPVTASSVSGPDRLPSNRPPWLWPAVAVAGVAAILALGLLALGLGTGAAEDDDDGGGGGALRWPLALGPEPGPDGSVPDG